MRKVKVSKKLIKKVQPFYAMDWSYNEKKVYTFDVLSYIIDDVVDELENTNKHALHYITDYNSFKEAVDSNLRYHFWARREFEIAVGDLPLSDFDNSKYITRDDYINSLEKISVYDQLKPNVEFIVNYLWNILEVEEFLKKKYGDK